MGKQDSALGNAAAEDILRGVGNAAVELTVGGRVCVEISATFDANASGSRGVGFLRRNLAGEWAMVGTRLSPARPDGPSDMTEQFFTTYGAGILLRPQIYQSSGTSINALGMKFHVHYIGPR